MKKIILVLDNHKWAILLAIVSSLIIVYPQIYFRYDHQNDYSGIELFGNSDDESAWMSRLREVQDGHFSFANAYFKEGKSDPYIFQPLGTIIVGFLGKLFALNINNTLLFSRLFFSFLVFLIIYAFILSFTKEKLTALTVSSALILAKSVFSRAGLAKMLAFGSPSTQYLELMRPVNPAMTYFFLFGFILFFWLFFAKNQWRWGIISAVFLGLSFYDYFYTWTFLCVFLGVLILIFLFQKRWRDIKKIALILLGSAIIAIPWFFNLYQLFSHPNYQAIIQRFGMLGGRVPVLSILAPLLFIAVLVIFPRITNKDRYFFALALASSPVIALNQHIVTGKVLSEGHYHWYFTFPLAVIFLFILFFLRFPDRLKFLKKSLAISAIFFSIFAGIIVQSFSYAFHEQELLGMQKYGPLTDWLNQNANPEEVVFANDPVSQMVVIYTPLNVFYHPSAKYTLAATKELLLDAVFTFYRLDGVGLKEANSVFLINKREISALIYSQYYRELTGDYSGIPNEIIGQFSEMYKQSLTVPTSEFLNDIWTKRRVNYVVWDKKTNPLWQLDQYPFLVKMADIGDFVIYQKI